MSTAYTILAIVMALMAMASGVVKLQGNPRVVEAIHNVIGVPMQWLPILALLEIAGGVGLLIGIFWAPLGLAAAVGLVLYFVGAIIAHVRVRDFKGMSSPILPLVVAVATLAVRILSF